MTDRPDSDGSSQESSGDSFPETPTGKDFETRRQGAVYQGAFEAVIAILVAALFGYWLDGYFETDPVFLLIGFAIGFASFTVRLVRLGRWVEGQGSGEDSNPSGGNSDQSNRNQDDRDDRDKGDESQNENER